MPGQRQFHFIFGNAGSVVTDADQFLPARLDIDDDRTCTGIQAVFHEFFYNRGRPLDDFAGSDLIDQVAWQLANGHNRILTQLSRGRTPGQTPGQTPGTDPGTDPI